MTEFVAKRIVRQFTHRVAAEPAQVFPLLCPVREYDWIDGWSCDVIYSDSGLVENDCIFTTQFPHLGRAVWTVSRHDPDAGFVAFVITYPATHVEKLEIATEREEPGATRIYWRRAYTALNAGGNRLIETFTGEILDRIMDWLGQSLDHYCRTGTKLSGSSPYADFAKEPV